MICSQHFRKQIFPSFLKERAIQLMQVVDPIPNNSIMIICDGYIALQGKVDIEPLTYSGCFSGILFGWQKAYQPRQHLCDRHTQEVVCTVQRVCLHGGSLQATGALGDQSVGDLPHSNQHNYSSTVLLFLVTAWRQFSLCRGMIADLVPGNHRPNFLGNAQKTAVFCNSHQGSVLQCQKQKQTLPSVSPGSQ